MRSCKIDGNGPRGRRTTINAITRASTRETSKRKLRKMEQHQRTCLKALFMKTLSSEKNEATIMYTPPRPPGSRVESGILPAMIVDCIKGQSAEIVDRIQDPTRRGRRLDPGPHPPGAWTVCGIPFARIVDRTRVPARRDS